MAGRKSDFTLTKLDDLFTTQAQRDEEQLSKIRDIPLELIDDFPDHPFKVRDDEDMMQLVESVKERGVITPATVRQKEDGRYELVSGHRRKRACELAGFETLRSEIVDLNRDEATILMVESNFQRSEILPSEKAFTDFWRVGKGYAKKLEEHGLFTMGDIARCSIGKSNELYNEELLYKLFGINAELLIDHAWGYEPCTMEQVKAYKPETNSVCSGQVLHCPYDYEKAKLIVKEMTDQMVLDLVDKGLVTDQLVLTIGYDIENLSNPNLKYQYKGEVTIDRYGRKVPKHAHGTANLEKKTSSTRLITNAVMDLYDRIVDEHLLVRRITITANKLVDEKSVKQEDEYQQLDLFTDYEAQRKKQAEEEEKLERERRMQEAMLSIKKKFGKNAVLKGMNLEEGATAKDRNEQIGGHKA